MSNELTYMDCWRFIAPLIPVNTDYKKRRKNGLQKRKRGGKLRMTRKRFIKLLMGKLLLSRNEANYIADIVRICDRRKP